MARLVRYLTHPQVVVDPATPVPDWALSAQGRARVHALIEAGWLAGATRVVSSGERKAIETAEPIAAALGGALETREAMGENDRSATGYLPPSEFERVADRFFAEPERSVRGWERAVDAQARIVREVEAVLSEGATGDVVLVGHGAVGTLLYCALAGLSIDRAHDQPAGGGCYFSFEIERRRPLRAWRQWETPPDA